MNLPRALFLAFSGIIAFYLPLGCSSPTPPTTVTITVSAATSLTEVLKEINSLYENEHGNVTIVPNFASSGTLQTQIENGAPVDVFISAAPTQMDNLQRKNLLVNDTRINLLNNKAVVIVPADSTLRIANLSDLASDRVKTIAIGDPKSVPAGTYAQMAFEQLGLLAKIQPKEVLAGDVRQVLTYVESKNVDAGIVYSTDARVSTKIKIVASAPEDINAKIVYPAAVITGRKNTTAAREYLNFLSSAPAKAVFEKYGFTVIEK